MDQPTYRIALGGTIYIGTEKEITRSLYEGRRERSVHPKGTFDKAGRFDLDPCERFDCCKGIRTPSRHWPYSQMLHGRTLKHCKALVHSLVEITEALYD